MGRTRLEGGSMRPEGSLDVIWPDYWILIQQQEGEICLSLQVIHISMK